MEVPVRALWVGLLASACTTATPDPPEFHEPFEPPEVPFVWPTANDNPRPDGSPDVVILTVAGHRPQSDTEYNVEYIAESGLTDSLRERFILEGKTVQIQAFVSEFFSWEEWNGETTARGFLEFIDTLERIQADWIDGFDNPTRLILVGHGHGVVWTHLATHLLQPSVDVLVDLDGHSACWEAPCMGVGNDWGTLIPEWSEYQDVEWAFDISTAEDAITVPNSTQVFDIQDVIPPNTTYNLSFHAQGQEWPFQNDSTPNVRVDGTTTQLYTNSSIEHHRDLYQPWSDAMQYTAAALRSLYFSQE